MGREREGRKGTRGRCGGLGRALLLRERGIPLALLVLAAQGGCTLRVANFLLPPSRPVPAWLYRDSPLLLSRYLLCPEDRETTSALMEDISPLIMINS
jgi:hypothetical protein